MERLKYKCCQKSSLISCLEAMLDPGRNHDELPRVIRALLLLDPEESSSFDAES